MVHFLLSLLLCFSLTVPATPIEPVNTYSNTSVVEVMEKPNKDKHKKHGNKGKRKGHNKGKHNPHGNNPPPRHNPPGQNNGGGGGGSQHSAGSPNRPVNPGGPGVQNNPATTNQNNNQPRNNVQTSPVCRIIVRPTKETVRIIEREVPRTKTVTEKVLYGTGLIVAIATGAAVLMLLIGFAVGWSRRKKNEEKFLNSVVDNE